MTGRTNAVSGGARLFKPTLSLNDSTLMIHDRNGDFCTGFTLSLGYDGDEVARISKTDDVFTVDLTEIFSSDGPVLVSATGLLDESGIAVVTYNGGA